jgi:hypothetical protein
MVLKLHAQKIHPDFKLKVNKKTSELIKNIEKLKRNVVGISSLENYINKFNEISINEKLNIMATIDVDNGRHVDKVLIHKNNKKIKTIPIPSVKKDLCEGTVKDGIIAPLEEILFENLAKEQINDFYNQKILEEKNLIYDIKGENVGVYIDTCHLLEIVNTRIETKNIFKDVFEIITKDNLNTIIFMKNVMEEFENNLKTIKNYKKREEVRREWNELKYNNLNKNIWIEEIEMSDENKLRLSERMKNNSSKNNSRLGDGEASIILHIEEYSDIFSKVIIYSNDSDINYLTQDLENVEIINTQAA